MFESLFALLAIPWVINLVMLLGVLSTFAWPVLVFEWLPYGAPKLKICAMAYVGAPVIYLLSVRAVRVPEAFAMIAISTLPAVILALIVRAVFGSRSLAGWIAVGCYFTTGLVLTQLPRGTD